MNIPTITINLDAKCAECGRGGAAASGICLRCTSKALGPKPLKSAIGRAVQRRNAESLKRIATNLNRNLRK